MASNSIVQHRAKYLDHLLARELLSIEREHSHNLVIHQQLENSIRRANNQSSNNNRTKISKPFDDIYNEHTGTIDYHNIRNNINSNQKSCLSTSASSRSNKSYNQTNFDQSDEFFDYKSSSMSLRRRQCCTKVQRLPLITKPNTSNQKKRENKNHHWMASFQQSNIRKENVNEPFTTLNEEITISNLSELTPIQRQVRSFLETLPTYKGTQQGFDSFAPASLYTHRVPIAIR
jgi:hypothetical protein